ncbi:MAG: hypothetical protein ABSD82_00575 [Solirubrobacteraceae bacterium]|jgi:hypothetical protein
MKRSVWAALGVVIVALAVPAAALATHHHSGGFRHHGHGHTAIRRGATGNSGATGSNSVTSYSGGTLVLALAGGGSITGSVTQDTRFVCIGQGWSGDRGFGGRGGRGGHWGRGGRFDSRRDSGPTGSTGWSGPTGSTGWSGSSGGRGRGGTGTGPSGATGGQGYAPPPPCDSSLLVSGAVVSEADVQVTPGGVLFSEIVLLPAVQ